MLEISEWQPLVGNEEAVLDALATVLHDTVHQGASVSFILPFSRMDARQYWSALVLPAIRLGKRRVLLASWDGEIVGTVQLVLDVPPNQRHRADVAKMLVHPSARRRGIARALMVEIERLAASEGKTLLTLDTREGSEAEPLYISLGYTIVGVIPRYAKHPSRPELEGATFFYKELHTSPSATAS